MDERLEKTRQKELVPITWNMGLNLALNMITYFLLQLIDRTLKISTVLDEGP